MSTRAQIIVEGNGGVKIYKHSDGYPEGVLPVLQKLLPRFKESRGFDAEYLTAHVSAAFINDSAESRKDFYKRSGLPNTGRDNFIGHGLGFSLHGDEEYIYVIDENFTVFIYEPTDKFLNAPTIENVKLKKKYTIETLIKFKVKGGN